MASALLPDLDPVSLRSVVDAGAHARGVDYARRKAVAQLRWEPATSALQGLVRGSRGQFYTTIAYCRESSDPGRAVPRIGDPGHAGRRLAFDRGACSCPVAVNCKHVVALVLTAADGGALAEQVAAHGPDQAPDQAQAGRAAWAAALDAMLGQADADPRAPVPLAIELTLVPAASRAQTRWQPATQIPPKLTARLVQPGAGGGWVAGSLSWSRLESLSFYGDYRAEHLTLLQEIYALYQSRETRARYYSYGEDRHIDLCAFESRQLWSLLDDAASAGLRLVHARKRGDVEPYRQAELCLDVTRSPAGDTLLLTPQIRLDAVVADVLPASFIGTRGHGLVCTARADVDARGTHGQPFQLARFVRPVPPELQRLLLAGQHLEVPAAEQVRFRDEYYPRLRLTATVTSSDGVFTPPVISGPTLLLRAAYQPGHHVDLSWEWMYQVGDSRLRVPAHRDSSPAQAGFRDIGAEQALLTGLDLPAHRIGPLRRDQRGLALDDLRLQGIDAMRFSTEVLPLLAGHPGVVVEVTGNQPDYREASDSLRIGVSAGEVPGDTDWFDLGITITVDEREVPFTDVFVALSRGESHLLLDDGAYFSLEKPELAGLARLIEEARALSEAPGGELRISRFQAGLWDELTELGVVSHQARAWQEQVQGLLNLRAIEHAEPPAALSARLRPYQQDGFTWLAFLWKHRLGGILADDMGLGKTIQSLALICRARHDDPDGPPFLIVAPTSVVPNWAAEAGRFAPGLKVVPVGDTSARRGQPLSDLVAGADVVVTSYTLARMDAAAYCALDWSCLLLDEAQFVKNHQSRNYQCARQLPAPVKIAITGTPMENNLMELWSLLSITAPGLFPNPVRFRDYYARPIEKGGDTELLAQLRRRMKPLVKRRTKEQVAADLPAKQEQVLLVDLHPRHRKLYQTHLQRERQKVLGLVDDLNANRFTIFRSLTLLRQLSLHAGLADAVHADLPSAKIDVLTEQLADVIGGGHRALVFSQFTGFLDLVRRRLDGEGVPYCYLDGKTRDRAQVLERFRTGTVPVFLISLKAGGFGLNLTEADYCFLLDPWWNPATEAQAVDRTHRIGQTRNVMVYRLIAKDTIEDKVMALKARKAELFASVLDDGNIFGAGLDADDIRGLLS